MWFYTCKTVLDHVFYCRYIFVKDLGYNTIQWGSTNLLSLAVEVLENLLWYAGKILENIEQLTWCWCWMIKQTFKHWAGHRSVVCASNTWQWSRLLAWKQLFLLCFMLFGHGVFLFMHTTAHVTGTVFNFELLIVTWNQCNSFYCYWKSDIYSSNDLSKLF